MERLDAIDIIDEPIGLREHRQHDRARRARLQRVEVPPDDLLAAKK